MGPNVSAPASYGVMVTANDAADLPGGACRGLLVGTGGVARVIWANGTDSGSANIPLQAGYNPISVKRIYLTGLVAATIVALY